MTTIFGFSRLGRSCVGSQAYPLRWGATPASISYFETFSTQIDTAVFTDVHYPDIQANPKNLFNFEATVTFNSGDRYRFKAFVSPLMEDPIAASWQPDILFRFDSLGRAATADEAMHDISVSAQTAFHHTQRQGQRGKTRRHFLLKGDSERADKVLIQLRQRCYNRYLEIWKQGPGAQALEQMTA